ncbi:MAG: pilus assembly protein [Eggerthellaceae bacterium]|nr:pilus assembly protein [Eggerthellaceae bacterium]
MKSEDDILRRLKRRLVSARASVMFEFAVVAPLIVATIAFAADFTRILRTEQQLEIATRLAADVEAHMADFYSKGASPGSPAKNIAKNYLVDVAHVATSTQKVLMKGGAGVVENFLTEAVEYLRSIVNGEKFEDSGWFWKLVGKILGGLINFVSFRTFNYLIDVIPHDRWVWISTATYIPTVLPAEAYSWLPMPSQKGGQIGVAQFTENLEGNALASAWSLKLNPKKRHRVKCYMPVIDSVPVAPKTYVRAFKSWCAKQKWLKGLVQ